MEDNQLLKTEEDIKKLKKTINKVLFSSILFFFIFNFSIILLSNITKDLGILSILSVTIAMIAIYYYIGKNQISKLNVVKRKFTLIDFIYFAGLILLLSYAFNIITVFLMQTFNIKSVNVTTDIQKNINPVLAIYVVLWGPFMEELQYRGFYLNHLKKHGAWLSIILSTLIFSFAHMNFLQGFGTLGIGLVLGYLAYFYSFKAALLMHIWNNFFVTALGLILKSDKNGNITNIPLAMIINLLVIGLLVYSFISTFKKKRRTQYREDLKLTAQEKVGLKSLYTNIFFWIYILFMVVLMIAIGSQ